MNFDYKIQVIDLESEVGREFIVTSACYNSAVIRAEELLGKDEIIVSLEVVC
jgi:hypothetical protein